jgi:hypothetical protein
MGVSTGELQPAALNPLPAVSEQPPKQQAGFHTHSLLHFFLPPFTAHHRVTVTAATPAGSCSTTSSVCVGFDMAKGASDCEDGGVFADATVC